MPNDPYSNLARDCIRVARTRPGLIAALELVEVSTLDDLFTLIRQFDDTQASDVALRRLAAHRGSNEHGCPTNADAVTLIVGALAPQLRAWTSRGRSAEFHDDLLGDLALVVCDAIDRGDFQTCDRLAARLRWRAHVRTSKRLRRTRVHGERNLTVTDPCSPEVLTILHAEHTQSSSDPVGDAAVARFELGKFAASCRGAVEAGSLPAKSWDEYREHRLRRMLVESDGPVPDADRKRAERAAAKVQVIINDVFGGHVA